MAAYIFVKFYVLWFFNINGLIVGVAVIVTRRGSCAYSRAPTVALVQRPGQEDEH